MKNVTPEQLDEFMIVKGKIAKLKKEESVMNSEIKESMEHDVMHEIGDFTVKISDTERTILDTKQIKIDFPKIYETYGKKQKSVTLSVKRI